MHFFEDPGPLHVLTGPDGGCPKRGTARNESRWWRMWLYIWCINNTHTHIYIHVYIFTQCMLYIYIYQLVLAILLDFVGFLFLEDSSRWRTWQSLGSDSPAKCFFLWKWGAPKIHMAFVHFCHLNMQFFEREKIMVSCRVSRQSYQA